MARVLSLRVESQAAGVTKEIGVLVRALRLIITCTTVEKVWAQHGVRMRCDVTKFGGGVITLFGYIGGYNPCG